MTEQVLVMPHGDDSLFGILHRPTSEARKSERPIGLLIVVGGPQYRVGSHRQFLLTAREVARAGFPVLRFDYRGMGDSIGLSRTFDNISEDIKTAIDCFIAEEPALEAICVFGLCDGASAALIYCNDDERVTALVLANPWVRTDSGAAAAIVDHYYSKRILQRDFWVKAFTGGVNPVSAIWNYMKTRATAKSESTSLNFIDRMTAAIMKTRCDVRILLSEDDLVAKEFDALCVKSSDWKAAIEKPSVSVVRLPGADHTFSNESHLAACNAEIVRFMSGCRNT
jgi:uncharacterized protein